MKKLQAALVVHRLAITRAILFSVVTLGMAWQISVQGKDLSAFTFWDWTDTLIGIGVLWGNQMLSFLDKTMARISSGRTPFDDGNGGTSTISKADVE